MTEYTLKEIEQGAWLVEIEGLSGGGPHGMGWHMRAHQVDGRIRTIATWLTEWGLPASLHIEKLDHETYRLTAAFARPEHARACCTAFTPGAASSVYPPSGKKRNRRRAN